MPSTGTGRSSARIPTRVPAWVRALPEAHTTASNPDAALARLLRYLAGGNDVAEPSERRMGDPEMNDVGPAAGSGQRSGKILQGSIRRFLVFTNGKGMQRRAQQAVEQHVAGAAVEVVGLFHALLELNVDVHAELACAGRGEAGEVGLNRARNEHRVGALPRCLAEVELELAHFVAAQHEPRAIVTLDPELDPEGGAEIRRRLERRRCMPEPHSRIRFDTG